MTRAALRDHVLRIPAILAYSLDKRYRPRPRRPAAGADAARPHGRPADGRAPLRAPRDDAGGRRRDRVVARATPLGRRAFNTASSDGNGLRARSMVEDARHRLHAPSATRARRRILEPPTGTGRRRALPGCQNDHLIADNLKFSRTTGRSSTC